MTAFQMILLLGLLLIIGLQIYLLVRGHAARGEEAGTPLALQLQQMQQQALHALARQVQQDAQAVRQENSSNFASLQQNLMTQLGTGAKLQQAQLDSFAQQLRHFSDGNLAQLEKIRATLEAKISDLQQDNGQRLEQMRQTVDEKLHATLETRLGESFKLVSERLEKVHQGLGEMAQLAQGVGDLKRVLSNVKTRGTWGEVQLHMLLEQVLVPEQYGKNVETIPGSGARVEFAIKLPGDGTRPVWLPIDAKFPREQYERLQEAAERGDAEGVALHGRELEKAVRLEAKTIAEKYVAPPFTTDFAILFLPTEGLYAELIRRPGLADQLQRDCRVSLSGPSTLLALLGSLQMGFRTLALEKRSSEVWQVLGAVKTEFGKFGDVLTATKLSLEKAAKNIEQAEVRSRQMARKLKSVEALSEPEAQVYLGPAAAEEEPV
jgi:DNA recombination protein RmuC